MSLLDEMIDRREPVVMFGDSELYVSPESCELGKKIAALRKGLLLCCGKENEELLDEYTEAVESREDFIAEHYFEQGYLVGQRQEQKRKELS